MNDFQRPPSLQSKVMLEDLLRLKRAERPKPEFWVDFERQMRAKQLAAIVRRDPWWRSWRNVLSSSARLHLPLGATAMLALAFVTVREYRHGAPAHTKLAPVDSASVASVARAQAPRIADSLVTTAAEVASDDTEAAQVSPGSSAVSAPVLVNRVAEGESVAVEAARPSSSVASSESESSPEMIGFSAGPNASPRSALRDSSGVMVANLSGAESDHSELLPVFARTHSFDSSLQDKSASVEPLSQVSTPRDTRRARLLASAVPTDLHSPEHSAARSRERITSQLNEQSLYDSITRLGVAGNRLSIKF
jgi:hypothetical protein